MSASVLITLVSVLITSASVLITVVSFLITSASLWEPSAQNTKAGGSEALSVHSGDL